MVEGYPRSMEQLHTALRNSFDGIKRDIKDIRTAHAFLVRANKELADAIDRTHKGAVSADQLNLLKIKLSDAVEEAKKVNGVEKKLDSALNRVDKKFQDLHNRLVLASTVEKKLNTLATRIDGVASKTQQRLSTDDFNTFVDEVNNELRQLYSRIEKAEAQDSKAIDMRIDEFRRELDSKRHKVDKETMRVEAMRETFVPLSSMERALEDINAEFNAIKADVETLRCEVGPVECRPLAGKNVTQKRLPKKTSKTAAADDDLDIEVIKTKGGQMEKPKQRMLFWGNVFIALAFGSLFVSVFLTFLRKTPWDSYTLWGGGIGFMLLGTILRITGIIKNKDE